MPFNADQLIDKLPKILPESEYYGDLTLDNILFDTQNNKFVLIDPSTTEYNSFIFDIAKLNQDLICKWFIRNKNCNLDKKLYQISESLNKYSLNVLILLLLLHIHNFKEQIIIFMTFIYFIMTQR